VSVRQPRRAGARQIERGARGGARAERFVAVLERRGRFLTAERVFPREREAAGSARRGASARVTVAGAGTGARGAAGRQPREGDLVLVQGAGRGSAPRVVRVLGRPDVARDAIEALMLEAGLERAFPSSVEREAAQAASAPTARSDRRRDLRELATFTIDPVSARDFDDALSAERLADGGTRVWVHIADVAAHVREGGSLDGEARRRATSVYVPGAVEPMLPHALSSDACSLMPGAERMAVTVELKLHGAEVRASAFYPSLICSDARLDYEQVDRIFAETERAAAPWGEPLAAARSAAAELAAARQRSGALVVDSEEPEFFFDEHGGVERIAAREQTESHRLVEHLMITANEAVASFLEARGTPCLYRVHERPDPERIERLVDQLASLEVPTPPLPEHMSSQRAADLVGEISVAIERHVARTGRGRAALSSLLLRSLKQAYYSPRNLGHAGLHSSSYCHFTSPIRRYPDLVCHRALLSALGAGEHAPRASELEELGVWTSEREREAMKLERRADDVGRCFLLLRLLLQQGHEQQFAGEITGLISAGAFVAFGLDGGEDGAARGKRPFEGMVPVRLLRTAQPPAQRGRSSAAARGGGVGGGERDWWELNEQGTILYGERSGATLRLGDLLAVSVERVEALRGRVDLVPAL